MEKYEVTKEDALIRLKLCDVLFYLELMTIDNMLPPTIENVLAKVDMSGEEWDD